MVVLAVLCVLVHRTCYCGTGGVYPVPLIALSPSCCSCSLMVATQWATLAAFPVEELQADSLPDSCFHRADSRHLVSPPAITMGVRAPRLLLPRVCPSSECVGVSRVDAETLVSAHADAAVASHGGRAAAAQPERAEARSGRGVEWIAHVGHVWGGAWRGSAAHGPADRRATGRRAGGGCGGGGLRAAAARATAHTHASHRGAGELAVVALQGRPTGSPVAKLLRSTHTDGCLVNSSNKLILKSTLKRLYACLPVGRIRDVPRRPGGARCLSRGLQIRPCRRYAPRCRAGPQAQHTGVELHAPNPPHPSGDAAEANHNWRCRRVSLSVVHELKPRRKREGNQSGGAKGGVRHLHQRRPMPHADERDARGTHLPVQMRLVLHIQRAASPRQPPPHSPLSPQAPVRESAQPGVSVQSSPKAGRRCVGARAHPSHR
jgi:hypothetical protein